MCASRPSLVKQASPMATSCIDLLGLFGIATRVSTALAASSTIWLLDHFWQISDSHSLGETSSVGVDVGTLV